MKVKFEIELNKLNDNEMAYSKLLDMAITSVNLAKNYAEPQGEEAEQLESFMYDIVDDEEQHVSTYKFSMNLGDSAIDNNDIEKMLERFLGGL